MSLEEWSIAMVGVATLKELRALVKSVDFWPDDSPVMVTVTPPERNCSGESRIRISHQAGRA